MRGEDGRVHERAEIKMIWEREKKWIMKETQSRQKNL